MSYLVKIRHEDDETCGKYLGPFDDYSEAEDVATKAEEKGLMSEINEIDCVDTDEALEIIDAYADDWVVDYD